LREAPALNATGRRRVATMLTFSQTLGNASKIDYDNIVTDENMRKVLKYKIPTNKVWYDRKGKAVTKKSGNEVAATPQVKTSATASGPKKSTKPKMDPSRPKRVGKSANIPKGVVISEGRLGGVSTVVAPTKVTELGNGLAEVPEKETSTTSVSVAPIEVAELGKESAGTFGRETSTASASAVPIKVVQLGKESAGASGKETPADSPEGRSAGITQAPALDVINIEDEPEESGKEVWKSAKRKGKEKVQESPKRTCFASDPEMHALTRVSEAKLLFGRPRFILPTIPVTQEIPVKCFLPDSTIAETSTIGEPLGHAPAKEFEARQEPDVGLESGDQPQVEPEPFLEPGDGLGTENLTVMELENPLETEAADLLEQAGDDLNPAMVVDSLGAEEPKEPQTATKDFLPKREEASTSQEGALIGSLREGLLAYPLETLLEILPEEFTSMPRTESSGELAETILHAQFQVSFMTWK
jgi:hypothetical protein